MQQGSVLYSSRSPFIQRDSNRLRAKWILEISPVTFISWNEEIGPIFLGPAATNQETNKVYDILSTIMKSESSALNYTQTLQYHNFHNNKNKTTKKKHYTRKGICIIDYSKQNKKIQRKGTSCVGFSRLGSTEWQTSRLMPVLKAAHAHW